MGWSVGGGGDDEKELGGGVGEVRIGGYRVWGAEYREERGVGDEDSGKCGSRRSSEELRIVGSTSLPRLCRICILYIA
jgi:hypothetical protein